MSVRSWQTLAGRLVTSRPLLRRTRCHRRPTADPASTSKGAWCDGVVPKRGSPPHVNQQPPQQAAHPREQVRGAVAAAHPDHRGNPGRHRGHRRDRRGRRPRAPGVGQHVERDQRGLEPELGLDRIRHDDREHRQHRDVDHDHPHRQLVHAQRDLGRFVSPVTTTRNEPMLTSRSFRAIGTTATVVVQDPARAADAQRMLATELEAIDLACSRFRPDSELSMLHENAGRTVCVGPLLFEALEVALDAAVPDRRSRWTRRSVTPSPPSGTTPTSQMSSPGRRHPLGPSARWQATRTCRSIPATAACASHAVSDWTSVPRPRRWPRTEPPPATWARVYL